MRLDAIAVGKDPPRDINVIIEVPVGGEPIKYEMDKASGTLVVDRFLYAIAQAGRADGGTHRGQAPASPRAAQDLLSRK